MEIDYKGIKVHFKVEGTGKAIVLLHGFLENLHMWESIKKHLENHRYKLISIDLLGHGKTDCLGYISTMEDMSNAVLEVLKKLRIRKATFIGHSMGGYVALAFAKKYPEKIKGICLVNSTAQEDSEDREKIRNRSIQMAKSNYKNLVLLSILNLFKPTNLSLFANEIEETKKQALETPVQGYIAAQEGMKIRENSIEFLKKATFKKLYIIGKNDPIMNSEKLAEEAKLVSADYRLIDGGHMSHIENKEVLVDSLLYFLKKV